MQVPAGVEHPEKTQSRCAGPETHRSKSNREPAVHSLKKLKDTRILMAGEEVGSVEEVYFDDNQWGAQSSYR
jgi:hypothetical protein